MVKRQVPDYAAVIYSYIQHRYERSGRPVVAGLNVAAREAMYALNAFLNVSAATQALSE